MVAAMQERFVIENQTEKHLHLISRQDALRIGVARYFTGIKCKRGHISERRVQCSMCYECRDLRMITNAEHYAQKRKERYWANREEELEKNKKNHAKHRAARNEKSRIYHANNREANLQSMRAWYNENRDHKISYQANRRRENPDYDAQYYEKNKAKIIMRYRQYYRLNRKRILETKAKWRERNPEYYKNYYIKYKPRHRELMAKWSKDNAHKISLGRARRELRRFPLSKDAVDDMRHIYEQARVLRHLGYDYHVDHIIPLQGDTVSGLHVPWNLQIIPARDNLSKSNKLLPEHAEWEFR